MKMPHSSEARGSIAACKVIKLISNLLRILQTTELYFLQVITAPASFTDPVEGVYVPLQLTFAMRLYL